MTRAARPGLPALARPLMLLALAAAGLDVHAQAVPETAASAPEEAASAAPVPAPAPLVLPPVPPKPVTASPLATVPARWSDLSPAEQAWLAPLQSDWAELSEGHRSKWLNSMPMMANLSPSELARMHERMRDWSRLTQAERRTARIGFQVAKQVSAEERRAKWEAYQALPPEKRQQLADKAAAREQTRAPVAKPLAAVPKSNTVPTPRRLVVPVGVPGSASLVQAKPGASTVQITRAQAQVSHQPAGQAKVVADPRLVDPKTLLPKSLRAPAPTPGT